MKRITLLILPIAILIALGLVLPAQTQSKTNGPVFQADNQLVRPANYREWIWVSSGLGMTYGPREQSNAPTEPRFDNVFVTPEAYRAFMKTGKWPNKTMFVLEIRSSQSHGSINKDGHFQGDLVTVEAEVKDESRFPETKWGFFPFRGNEQTAKPAPPATTECQSCHSRNGAVDNTFVQFYPTLLEVAKQKGTLRPTPPDSK
jgi:Cytochrome P460